MSPNAAASHDELVRRFWASFLESKVRKDGQVPGVSDWYRGASDWARKEAERHAHWCAVKILRDGRDPEECIASGVAALRRTLLSSPPEPIRRDSDQAYAVYRQALIERILSRGMIPIEVATDLEAHADEFPQIEYQECVRLRAMNDVWQPLHGPRLSEERVAQIRRLKALGLPLGFAKDDAVAHAGQEPELEL